MVILNIYDDRFVTLSTFIAEVSDIQIGIMLEVTSDDSAECSQYRRLNQCDEKIAGNLIFFAAFCIASECKV